MAQPSLSHTKAPLLPTTAHVCNLMLRRRTSSQRSVKTRVMSDEATHSRFYSSVWEISSCVAVSGAPLAPLVLLSSKAPGEVH